MAGGISRETFLAVLRASNVVVVEDHGIWTFSTATVPPESHQLAERIGRQLIGRAAAKFGISAQLFWHPELLKKDQGGKNARRLSRDASAARSTS